jgi:hypothetical protein
MDDASIRPIPQQLRDDIDSGRTGDKAAAIDPAAAPLGTDDEAAGAKPKATGPQPAREASAPGDGANASSKEVTPSGMGIDTRWLAPSLAGAALGVVFTVLLAAAL